jgi:plasmid maintenance system antidote protein VapI
MGMTEPRQVLQAWVDGVGSIAAAARELGIERSMLSRILHGSKVPNLAGAVRIEAVVGIDAGMWLEPGGPRAA